MALKPPVIKGLPLIGNAIQIAKSGSAPKFHLYIHENHRKYGPVFWLNLGPHSGYFISEPTAARYVFLNEGKYPRHVVPTPWVHYNEKFKCKRGLFFMDDEEWHKYRRILNPIFFKNGLVDSLQNVYDVVTDSFIRGCSVYEGKEIPDLEGLMYNHSMSFSIANLVGSAYINKIDSLQDDIKEMSKVTNSIFTTTASIMNLPVEIVANLNLPSWRSFVKAVEASLQASRRLMEKLMTFDLSDGILKEMLEENMDIDILQALVLDLMLAAGDTTAFTSQWALYLLGQHPDVAERLHENKSFSKNVVKETLRMYPTAIFLSRYLNNDLRVYNYVIPKGALAMISMYTLGKSNEIYPEADKYLPERWTKLPNKLYKGVNEPMAFFPFALGKRACIGKRLATAQIEQTLYKIVSNYYLEVKETVDMELCLVPVPSHPIKLILKKRG